MNVESESVCFKADQVASDKICENNINDDNIMTSDHHEYIDNDISEVEATAEMRECESEPDPTNKDRDETVESVNVYTE